MSRSAPSWSLLAIVAAAIAFALSFYFQPDPDISFLACFSIIYAILAFLRLIWMVVIWPRLFSPLCYLPHPPGGLSFMKSIRLITEEESGLKHREWINSVSNDGLIRYLLLGGMERVFLTSPKAISDAYVVHSYDYERPSIAHEILSRLLGFGLLLAEGEEHRVQRKNLNPAFTYRHVRDLVPTFWSISAKMAKGVTEDIQRQSVGTSFIEGTVAVISFDAWVNRATLDIVGAAGLGFEFGAVEDPNNELNVTYRKAFKISLQEQVLQLTSIFISFRFLEYLPLKRNYEVRDSVGIIRAASRTLIEKKRQEIAEKGFSEHKDILSIALQSGNSTVNNLVDQVMTFLAAGHETTATATQWAMVALAQHPPMQERLRSEVREHLPSIEEDKCVVSEDFDKMPYFCAFCQEVLRYWVPVPFTQREAIRDTQISGHYIPKGTNIVVLPSAMNHSKELWGEDADQFKPERWLQPGCAKTGGAESPYANLTFGAGPRGCIGATFAKFEFQCLVATLVGRFEVELDPPDRNIELEIAVVMRPKGGLPLRMKVIGGW